MPVLRATERRTLLGCAGFAAGGHRPLPGARRSAVIAAGARGREGSINRSPAQWSLVTAVVGPAVKPWAFGAAAAAAAAAAVAAGTAVGSHVPVTCAQDDFCHELFPEEQRAVALFERCSASVVHINTFAQRYINFFDLAEIPQGTGSGFIWDSQHVVTNYHVLKDADKAVVVLADGTVCEAAPVGIEPDSDLAVLRIKDAERYKLLPLERGRSSSLHVGQKVFAIGNPFGLDQTLTKGIVSGLGRQMRGLTGKKMRGLVQTDAAINPGNSGGPLLDARGRLIGVNTMIASPSGAFAGVGFAIPVDMVVRVVQQLVKRGHAEHAYLGVYLAHERFQDKGALVIGVEPGSPAAQAGLKPMVLARNGLLLGDEIIAIDGQKVSSAEQLLDAVEEHAINEEVKLTYRRHSQASESDSLNTVTVRLGERPQRRTVEEPAVWQRQF